MGGDVADEVLVMPIYEYKCRGCGAVTELLVMSRKPTSDYRMDPPCPCGERFVDRIISAPAVHFKGSGFYETDYRVKS